MPALLSALLYVGTPASAQNIFTIAGIPPSHRDHVDSQPALKAPLNAVYGLLLDRLTGRLLFNDQLLVLRLEPDGSLLAVAGTGSFPAPPPSLTATTLASALGIQILRGMAQDAAGNIYLADAENSRVYRLALDGTVTTFAGGGVAQPGFQSDGGAATAAYLGSPRGLVFDSHGNLDIAEVYCNCIRRVTPTGVISTVYTLPPSPISYRLPNIEGLAIDANDNLYFTEWFGNVVGKVASDGSGATIVAGTGTPGFSGDGGPAASAQLNGPSGVTLDSSGGIYIADTMNNRIRKITPDGNIATIAGSSNTCAFSGDGGPALTAQFCEPAETIFDASGNLIVADYGNSRVRQISADGTIATIAGSGVFDSVFSTQSGGDGGPAIRAKFASIGGEAFDSNGNLFISDTFSQTIREISSTGTVSTFVGAGVGLVNPGPLAFGPDGGLYVITGNSKVFRFAPDATVHLVAGTGVGTGLDRSEGDGGPAVDATLNEPGEVAFDHQGNIYIADTSNARVRKIDTNGIITTVAGPGAQGIDYYNGVAVDAQGNLYVAWTHAQPPSVDATVNRVNADGSFTRVAGSGQPCQYTGGPFIPDGMPALQVPLCAVIGLAVDPSGLLDMSEGVYSLVLRLNADGTIQRVAGSTTASATAPVSLIGDGGPAAQASLVSGQGWSPETVTFDPAGNLYIAEAGLNVIREVTATPYKLMVNTTGPITHTQSIAVTGNFAEPFPYAVRVTTTGGGAWLSANRTTGLTGESIAVNLNPAGLSSGVHQGTVAILASVAGGTQEVDVPVTLTVP